jgi:hypothetical protein
MICSVGLPFRGRHQSKRLQTDSEAIASPIGSADDTCAMTERAPPHRQLVESIRHKDEGVECLLARELALVLGIGMTGNF